MQQLDNASSSSAASQSRKLLLDNCVDFLNKYKWIYDFQVTELFSKKIIQDNFPPEWIKYFRTISNDQLNQMVTECKSDQIEILKDSSIPSSLHEFIKEAKNLRARMAPVDMMNAYRPAEAARLGMSAKKQHEIETMVPFISDLCAKHQCKCVIDIGSGLGHFDRLLVEKHSKLHVVGVEKQVDLTNESNKQVNDRIRNISLTINESNGHELLQAIKQMHSDQQRFGMIGLHSCGDLLPSMLRIFVANKCEDLKFLAAFSCCYHKMECQLESQEENKSFRNFPMSNHLRATLSELSFFIGTYGLRLAAQQTASSWRQKTQNDHDEHEKQVAYRAVLDAYCSNKQYKMKKLKRKLANKREFESFSNYVKCLMERVEFVSCQTNQIVADVSYEEIETHYYLYESYFNAIEPLTALQTIVQPLVESLILNDRIVYLNENGIDASLIRLFDDSISPRSICIIANATI